MYLSANLFEHSAHGHVHHAESWLQTKATVSSPQKVPGAGCRSADRRRNLCHSLRSQVFLNRSEHVNT
jgi:hypothetical protein